MDRVLVCAGEVDNSFRRDSEDKTSHNKQEQRNVTNAVISEDGPILAALTITTLASQAWELHVFDVLNSAATTTLGAVVTEKTGFKHKLQDGVFPAV